MSIKSLNKRQINMCKIGCEQHLAHINKQKHQNMFNSNHKINFLPIKGRIMFI